MGEGGQFRFSIHFVCNEKKMLFMYAEMISLFCSFVLKIFYVPMYGKLKILQFTSAYRTMDGTPNGSILY